MKIISVEIPFNADYLSTSDMHRWLLDNIGPGVTSDVDAWRHPGNTWSIWTKMSGKDAVIVGEFLNVEAAMQFKFTWS